MRNQTLAGIVMVLFAATLWGTTGTAQSIGSTGLPAHWVGALRLVFAAFFFAAFLWVERWRSRADAAPLHQAWRARMPWVLLGGLGMAAYNLSFFAGVKASSVAVGTAIALGSGPIWAGLLSLVFLRRAPSRAWWTGTLLAIAGGCWMVLGSAAQLRMSGTGVALCLVAGLSYAAYALASTRLVEQRVPAAAVTCSIFGCAALMATPLAWWATGAPATTPQGWGVVLYLGIAATGVAYLLFTHALQRIRTDTAVSLSLAEPLVAFGLAVLVVGERPPVAAYAGLLLVLLGLVLVMRAEMRPGVGASAGQG